MSDDHKGPTSHRRRRSGIDSVSGKCVVCASSIVAGIAGVGLSWLPASGLPATAPATRFGAINLVDASDSFASLENLTIILPGADDSVVLPSDDVINLPFGGDGLNNFFGAGEAGAAGSAADTATGQTWDSFTTPVEQITIPFLNDTIVLPGSNDTFSYLSSLLSGDALNLPFSDGEIDIFGYVFGNTGTAASDASSVEAATGSAGSVPTTATDSIPSNAIVLPGSADNIVFPSFNTINLPFGGDGENNIGGGGNGGDGGVGTGIGTDGTAGETAATAASNSDSTVTVTADTSGTGGATYLSGAGETILFPANNTISFPFGGDGENDFLGGGGGGNGGDGTGIGTGGTGDDVTGIGIGIGGDGGTGGNGAEFFPVQINFVDSSGASAVTVADSSASSSDGSSESLDDFLAGFLGSNGGSNVSDATGTAIGIGGDGGDGGNGAVLGATGFNVNTADLSATQSASLDGFLDSLLSSGDSTAVAGQAGSTVTDGTSVSIDGSGGAGGGAAEFFPITLDWDDATGDHSVTVTPVVLLEDIVSYFGSGATDSTSSSGDLGDLLGSSLPTLMTDLSSLF
ncbi:MAG TPA: hypothetical protein VMS16_03735 [Mycobacterium sp.]|nr:hypothetical protein [Mycobacterium sp.]